MGSAGVNLRFFLGKTEKSRKGKTGKWGPESLLSHFLVTLALVCGSHF